MKISARVHCPAHFGLRSRWVMPMRCCRLAGALLLLCHLAPSSPAAALPSPACSRHGRTAGCVDTECCAPHGHLKRVSLSRLGTRPAFVPVWPVGRIVDQDRRLGMQFRQPWAVNCARGELPEHFGKAEPKTSFALARALSLSLSCEKQQKGSSGGRGVQDQSSPANKQDSDNSVPGDLPASLPPSLTHNFNRLKKQYLLSAACPFVVRFSCSLNLVCRPHSANARQRSEERAFRRVGDRARLAAGEA
eukprot:3932203-Rhodomonas_salina.1